MTVSLFDRDVLGQFSGQSDVGIVRPAGTCTYDSAQQSYTIASAGQNVWGDHDDFHFVWKRITGNFIVTTQAALLGDGGNPHRKMGWMARTSLDSSAPNICTGIHGDGLLTLQYRETQGGTTGEVRAPRQGADVIQLERDGDNFIMSVARFGEPFESVRVENLDLGQELYVGLYVCSHEAATVEQAVFHNVRIVIPVGADFNRGQDTFASHLEILDIDSGRRKVIYSEDFVFEAPNWMRDGRALIQPRRSSLSLRPQHPRTGAD